MRLYKDFYENFVPGDSGFSGMPQLILICEDEKHMAECFKEIVTNQVEIPQIKLYFSTDLRQNEETLENTLVDFPFLVSLTAPPVALNNLHAAFAVIAGFTV